METHIAPKRFVDRYYAGNADFALHDLYLDIDDNWLNWSESSPCDNTFVSHEDYFPAARPCKLRESYSSHIMDILLRRCFNDTFGPDTGNLSH